MLRNLTLIFLLGHNILVKAKSRCEPSFGNAQPDYYRTSFAFVALKTLFIQTLKSGFCSYLVCFRSKLYLCKISQ